MSMGKWNEDAQTDETVLIRDALKRNKSEMLRLAALKKLGITDKQAETLVPEPVVRRGRPVGGSYANRSKFPYRDNLAERNFRVKEWTTDKRHIEYSPVHRYAVPDIGVDKQVNTSYSSFLYSIDPNWLVENLSDRTAPNGQNALEVAYELIFGE